MDMMDLELPLNNPYPEKFPLLEKVYLFSNCPHFARTLKDTRKLYYNNLAHTVSNSNSICFKNKLVMQVEDVWWHEYAHILGNRQGALGHDAVWRRILEKLGKGYLANWKGFDDPRKFVGEFKSDPIALADFLKNPAF